MDRLPLLRQLVEQRPEDPFPRYGLAMELRKLGRLEEADEVFEALTGAHPSYVPSYLMWGMLRKDMGRPVDAKTVLTRGIEIAGKAGDAHARGELEEALAGID